MQMLREEEQDIDGSRCSTHAAKSPHSSRSHLVSDDSGERFRPTACVLARLHWLVLRLMAVGDPVHKKTSAFKLDVGDIAADDDDDVRKVSSHTKAPRGDHKPTFNSQHTQESGSGGGNLCAQFATAGRETVDSDQGSSVIFHRFLGRPHWHSFPPLSSVTQVKCGDLSSFKGSDDCAWMSTEL